MLIKFWLGTLNGRDHYDGVGIDRKLVDVQEIGYEKNYMSLIGPRLCQIETSCDHDNERSSFIKGEKILKQARDNLLKMNTVPWNKLTVQICKDGLPYRDLIFTQRCNNSAIGPKMINDGVF